MKDLQEMARVIMAEDVGKFCVNIADARALLAEVERLRAVVAKLPKTADGVAIMPEMVIWVWHRGQPLAATVESVGHAVDLRANPWGSGTIEPHVWFYSTCEAAEAAYSSHDRRRDMMANPSLAEI